MFMVGVSHRRGVLFLVLAVAFSRFLEMEAPPMV
jgi:hypothetical protein